MPQCGCFHSYELSGPEANEYQLSVSIEGRANLDDLLMKAGLVTQASVEIGWGDMSFSLSGVVHEAKLRGFLDLLRSTVLVDLRPSVDECYALGPYTVFDDEKTPGKTALGSLLNQAKYQNDRPAWTTLSRLLQDFVVRHPNLGQVDCIVSAPKSDLSTPDLAGQWARDIARNRGLHS